ncbi:helix-turn-helix domain-containing protein [Streptomyces flavofungini]|uniref:helix-turn-helix domain-containing protein n=1 Tax=Streptomyces flavofungini TaxID=68200 RepID=UPI0025AFB9A1|nr:helix-turn-helix domain-containing protein [Streptomyces flavofungini]WJV50934.1 helix-turn-helix domain-containing protein [Streptomyces flavofungini]
MTNARREDLGRMLRSWRMARDPARVPGIAPARGHRSYLTQLDIALLLGVSERWYRALEKGEDRRYGREMIAGIARILDLSPRQTAALHRGTGHEPPARRPDTAPAGTEEGAGPGTGSGGALDPALVQLMREQRHVSFLCDQAWDVVDANTVAARHCPWLVRPGANVMTWAFSQEARYQLRDWDSSWAVPLLTRLRLAWQRWPDNTRLDEVVGTVRAAPGVAAFWDAPAPAPTEPAPEDDVRPMYFPLLAPDPVDVRVLACGPYDDTSLRWYLVIPKDGTLTFP